MAHAYLAGNEDWNRVRYRLDRQSGTAARFGRDFVDGSLYNLLRNEQERRRGSVAQLLRIYAPELSDKFQAATGVRSGLLDELLSRKQRVINDEASARELAEALAGSLADLNAALSELRQFMRGKIAP
ncbi:MAG TPA: hypothetical protein VMU95_11700 [Trebonia sp.]|nr:hypothetical protein [Trebonia sp.]